MNKPVYTAAILVVLLLSINVVFASQVVHHTIKAEIDPKKHNISVINALDFSKMTDKKNSYTFFLNANLKVKAVKGDIIQLPDQHDEYYVPVIKYEIKPEAQSQQATIQYSGEIYHSPESAKEEYARSFGETPGLIGEEGIFLAKTSVWYPLINDTYLTFELQVSIPTSWKVVSQGERINEISSEQTYQVSWKETGPQDEIYLIGGKFTEYKKHTGSVDALAFLREPDAALAQRYLDVTAQYIEMYRQLIGPYPYTKFALIENFWETGYGMPSFTLLGPQVIRLPFILHSSYPHEILHNWWGNSVYPDYETGNWGEGLTAYLADHLIQEQRGNGASFRRNILQGYADFVNDAKDFPLTEFTSRHSASSQAIGYGKTQMLFNMLRHKLGDQNFKRGLKMFYQQFKFKKASFDDLQSVFSEAGGVDLKSFFAQWVTRTGAPQLTLAELTRKKDNGKWKVEGLLKQVQAGQAYELDIPVAITLAGHEKAYQTVIHMNEKSVALNIPVEAEPIRIDVDSEFDVFRRLDRAEIPPALSQAFGDDNALIVLPSKAPAQLKEAYKKLVATWQKSQPARISSQFDNELDTLPTNQSLWVLGRENRFADEVTVNLDQFGFTKQADSFTIGGKTHDVSDNSFILSSRSADASSHGRVLITTDNPKAVPGIARKLPHYRKYSYLAFRGDEPENFLKGQWTVLNSPMSYTFSSTDARSGKLAARQALAQLPPVFSQENILNDIRALVAPDMEGRGIDSQGIDKAADYIAEAFKQAGLQPGGDNNSFFQTWQEKIEGLNKNVTLKNIIAVLPGSNSALRNESVVVGAHYDHLGFGWPDAREGNKGKLHPGADDNSSAVAILLELARIGVNSWKPERSIVFVAFTAEELNALGSRHYVKNYQRYPAKQAIAAINLDTIGRLNGNPITVFGADTATEWKHLFRGVGFVTGIKINTANNDFGSSDQVSFHEIGVPAVQLFGSMHSDFHSPGDTIDKLDIKGILQITNVVKESIEYLAARPEPLTSTLSNSSSVDRPKPPRQGRRVSLGTIPDFNYNGPGVLITGTTAGSPAEQVGLKEGDIITKIDKTDIKDLRTFGGVLRNLKPGDQISITVKRGEETLTKTVTLKQR